MGRKITILGMGPTAYRKADCIEQFIEGHEVWSLNNAYLVFPQLFSARRFDKYFEIHSWEYLQTWSAGEMNGQKIDHFKTLAQLDCNVVTSERLPLMPKQSEYPFDSFISEFGEGVEVKGSPSWMMALALLQHSQGRTIDEIQVFGIDTSDPSHASQRPSWAQWTLRAELAGIKLTGTALDFRKDTEQDEGLKGLLEHRINIFENKHPNAERLQELKIS